MSKRFPEMAINVNTSREMALVWDAQSFKELAHNDELNQVWISLYELDEDGQPMKNKKIGELTLLLTEDSFPEEMLDIADECSQDYYEHFNALINASSYDESYDEYEATLCEVLFDESIKIVSGALYRLFVYPEYRGRGVGSVILDNLPAILNNALNVRLRYLVTYPKPDDGTDETYKIMVSTLEKHKFEATGMGNYYIRDYLLDLAE